MVTAESSFVFRIREWKEKTRIFRIYRFRGEFLQSWDSNLEEGCCPTGARATASCTRALAKLGIRQMMLASLQQCDEASSEIRRKKMLQNGSRCCCQSKGQLIDDNSKQNRKQGIPLLTSHSPSSTAPLTKPNREPAGKKKMWFAESQL